MPGSWHHTTLRVGLVTGSQCASWLGHGVAMYKRSVCEVFWVACCGIFADVFSSIIGKVPRLRCIRARSDTKGFHAHISACFVQCFPWLQNNICAWHSEKKWLRDAESESEWMEVWGSFPTSHQVPAARIANMPGQATGNFSYNNWPL